MNHLQIQVFWDMTLCQLVNITDVWEVPPFSVFSFFRLHTHIMEAAISSKRLLTLKWQAEHCPIQCMCFSSKSGNTVPQLASTWIVLWLTAQTWHLKQSTLMTDYEIWGPDSSTAEDSSLLECRVVSLVARFLMFQENTASPSTGCVQLPSEMLRTTCLTTWCHIPNDQHLHHFNFFPTDTVSHPQTFINHAVRTWNLEWTICSGNLWRLTVVAKIHFAETLTAYISHASPSSMSKCGMSPYGPDVRRPWRALCAHASPLKLHKYIISAN
jgi:hypothetical protein